MLDGRFTPEELVDALKEKFGTAPKGLIPPLQKDVDGGVEPPMVSVFVHILHL
jgi:hypothetical protein